MAKRVKPFDGRAKSDLKRLMNTRHSNPQLAARTYSRMRVSFSHEIIMAQVRSVNPGAVEEIEVMLKMQRINAVA